MRSAIALLAFIAICAALGYTTTHLGLRAIVRQQQATERSQLIRCQQGYQHDCRIIVAREMAQAGAK